VPTFTSHSFITCCCSFSPSCIGIYLASMSRPPRCQRPAKLSHDSSVICSRRTHDICHACQLGRHTRLPFVSSNSRADKNFDLLHYDMWTSLIVSISSYKYYLVILDDRSHFVWNFPLHVKSDSFSTLSKNRLCLHTVWSHHQSRPV
jgi:hypothetical protein